MRRLTYFLLGILLALCIATVAEAQTIPPYALGSEINIGNVVALINYERIATSSKPLNLDPILTKVAQSKADDEVKRQYFSHTNPEGEHVWKQIKSAGYEFRYAGENLAVGTWTVQEEHQKWMASPKHQENILSQHYEDVGVGIAYGNFNGRQSVYVVILFAQKKTTK